MALNKTQFQANLQAKILGIFAGLQQVDHSKVDFQEMIVLFAKDLSTAITEEVDRYLLSADVQKGIKSVSKNGVISTTTFGRLG